MQRATERPEPTTQRKAAIASGAVHDHAGRVRVEAIPDFDLDRTIFQTLEGRLPRLVMRTRVGKSVTWSDEALDDVEAGYAALRGQQELPPVDSALLRFMVDECDFDVEHADGSFLDHLYFCFEYTAAHYPEGSPTVMLLHSILGTGTNTFAMEAAQIPALRALLGQRDWLHIESFPSLLRLLYDRPFREELRANLGRLDALREIRLHRVIDNAPITLGAADLWEALNYQLIHLTDFLPVANWGAWKADASFIVFRDLFDILEQSGRRVARVGYAPGTGSTALVGEHLPLAGRLTARIPVALGERFAAASVRRFSASIGHDIGYSLVWD